MQKEIVSYYLEEFTSDKETDIKILIEQAKALKDMVVNESLRGNTQLIRYFTKIGEFLMECYDKLPEENKDQKIRIEEAIKILGGNK